MNSFIVLLAILVLLMLFVSKKEGLRNLFGLAINFGLIIVMISLIALGFNAILVVIVFSLIILAVAIFLSSEEAETTDIAFKSSLIVMLSLLALVVLLQYLGQFQGFAIEDTEELEELSTAIGVNFSNIAIVVIVISMIGAVAEAAMALTANLFEVIEQDEAMTLSQFRNQRLIISQQILGTAVNTLFFGLLGSSVGLVLWFVRLHYKLSEILNSKLLMADLAAMLVGMLGILLAIWLAGYFVEREFDKKKA
ncbi:YibE/F family protein [Lactococcus termiticola]|uniref:Membrane protein n=1 Tax=Lactococcus termiticola TaxID=2169526 RepID=A0A2R5HF74_9LACT|nr:YibE/F family protein [Lactococcus termiticola]GBG96713.1 membrane protein [Lactococcus termiticola]